MDISIGPLNTAGLTRPTPSPVPAPAAPSAQAVHVAISKAAFAASADSEKANDAAVVKQMVSFEHTYAVSDTKFALYKDASGQMITRYVSLRDGSITYMPAPNYAKPTPPQVAIRV